MPHTGFLLSFIKLKKAIKQYKTPEASYLQYLALSENFKKNNSQEAKGKIVWTGIAENLPEGISSDKFDNEHFDIAPVKISARTNDLFYGGFCNDLIWPLFHYFPSYSVFNKNYFEAYKEANTRFCEEIVKVIKPGDYVWVHDYQLFLLPEMIRKRVPDVTISFFLHIPFPSFELFRLIPRHWREETG